MQHPHNLLLAALCLGLAACASHRPRVPEAPIKAPAPAPVAIGRVYMVNEELGFVLVETPESPETGMALQARTPAGEETASLKVSVSQDKKRLFVIADVMKGKPHVGDVVTK